MANFANHRINQKRNSQKRRWEISVNKSLREVTDGPRLSYRNGKRGKFCGLQRSLQDTGIDSVNIKSQQTLRAKRVKPTMPKMPWDV